MICPVNELNVGAGRGFRRYDLKVLPVEAAGQVEENLNALRSFGMRLTGQML